MRGVPAAGNGASKKTEGIVAVPSSAGLIGLQMSSAVPHPSAEGLYQQSKQSVLRSISRGQVSQWRDSDPCSSVVSQNRSKYLNFCTERQSSQESK